MTVREMADLAGLHRNSVLRAEGQTTLAADAYAAEQMQEALEEEGIVFSVQDGYASVSFKAARQRKRCNYTKRA